MLLSKGTDHGWTWNWGHWNRNYQALGLGGLRFSLGDIMVLDTRIRCYSSFQTFPHDSPFVGLTQRQFELTRTRNH